MATLTALARAGQFRLTAMTSSFSVHL